MRNLYTGLVLVLIFLWKWNIYFKNHTLWNTHDRVSIWPSSNYTWSLCIDFSHTGSNMLSLINIIKRIAISINCVPHVLIVPHVLVVPHIPYVPYFMIVLFLSNVPIFPFVLIVTKVFSFVQCVGYTYHYWKK